MPAYFLFPLIIFSYLLGSIPTGIVAAKAFGGVDPRTAGSKNIGATNVGRTSGKIAGAVTLVGDILKGSIPVILAFNLIPDSVSITLTGLFAFLGHLFPVFLKFKGGKGVATACGVMVVISPLATLLSGVVFLIVALPSRYVSLGSISAAVAMPVLLFFLPGGREYTLLGLLIGWLVVIKHKDNIKRLMEGSENRF